MIRFLPVSALFVVIVPSQASAHIELLNPANQYDDPQAYQKSYPCGDPANMPPQNGPTTLTPGETITIELDEYVGHQGHFRVAIDPDSNAFVDPASFSDFYNAPNVFLDDVEDPPNGTGIRSFDFEVPDIDCDPCFMQVMQIMENPSGELNGNDFYYQCAQVVIEGQGTATTGADTGDTGGSSEDSGPGESTGGDNGDDVTGSSSPADTSMGDASDSGTSATSGIAEENEGGDDGCSCTTTNSPSLWWGWALLVLGAPRRRALSDTEPKALGAARKDPQ